MVKITDKELKYLKEALTKKQLIDLVALKSQYNKANNKKLNEAELNLNEESEDVQNNLYFFYNDFILQSNSHTKDKFKEICEAMKPDSIEVLGDEVYGTVLANFEKFVNDSYDILFSRDEDFDDVDESVKEK